MKKLLFAIIAVSFFQCESLQLQKSNTTLSDMVIKSGQSFGMCIGPCHQEMVIEGNKITLIVTSRASRGSDINTTETKYYDSLTAKEITKLRE